MADFNYRELLINIGSNIPAGCRGANWPDSCHVVTCLMGSKWCGIPSTVRTVPIGDELQVVLQAGVTVETLRADLKRAVRELDRLEKKGTNVKKSIAGLDALSDEIDAVRREISKGSKTKR